MTIVCWDGQTLAADREAGDGWVKCHATVKIARVRGHLIGGSGPAAAVREIMHWFGEGANPLDFHDSLRKLDNLTLLAISPERRMQVFQHTPYPVEYVAGPLGNRYAIGSGREAALAVMLLGYDAVRAVQVASMISSGCGNGIDTLDFGDAP